MLYQENYNIDEEHYNSNYENEQQLTSTYGLNSELESELESELHGGGKNKEQVFLGEGSYGCVIKPGYNCNGDKNNIKNSVTKLTEINFSSKNELIVSKQIKNIKHNNKKIYKKHFAPIFDHCIIEFNKLSKLDINKCENFLDNINYLLYNQEEYSNFIKNKFYIFYVRYIYGAKTIHKYLDVFSNYNELYKNYISTFHYLLISIMLMQKNKIVHNDLFDRNIIFDKKLNLPIIIDFGLSYQISRLYNGSKINLKMLNKFFFDFRSDSYQYNIDKRFITFFSYNKNDYYNIKVTKLNQKNDLNQQLLDIFIDDAYNSILQSTLLIHIFTNDEIKIYKSELQNYYGKFLNKKLYPTSSSIIKKILPNVIKFTDVYSICIEYIKIYISLMELHDKNLIFRNLFLQLFKKVLFPNPDYRLDSKQLRNIIEFIISKLNSFNLNNFDSEYNKFISDFDECLKTNNINKDIFFFMEFAYINFKKILTHENIKLFKDYKLSYYNCHYI